MPLKIFKTRKRIFLSVVGALFLTGAGLAFWAFLIEPNRLVVHEVDIRLAAWPNAFNNLKIVSVSDLHVGRRFIDDAKLVQIVEAINQTEPDLIVLLGDFVSQDNEARVLVEPEIIAGRLKNLKAKHGVFAVLGNHDWWYNGQLVRKALEAVGIRVLENDAVQIENDGQSFWLLGVPDYWTRQPLDIRPGLQKITSPGPVIAITHNPDIFPELQSNISLTLAGHTHGGQVNFPFFGRPVVPSKFGERYAAGLIQENNRQLFVTTGIGTTGIAVRFRVPPEISVLKITAR